MKLIHNGDVKRVKTDNGEYIIAEFSYPVRAEVLWQLFATKQGLERWFCTTAHVTAGVDGLIGFGWEDKFNWIDQIIGWELNKRLTFKPTKLPDSLTTLESLPVKMPDEMLPYTIDYTFEADGDNTIMRLLQTGFLNDKDWDTQLDSFKDAWMQQFVALEHLIHYHLNDQRTYRRVQALSKLGKSDSWNLIVGKDRMFRPDPSGSFVSGESFEFRVGSTIRESASLIQATEFLQLNLNLDGLNNSFLGFGVWPGKSGNWLVIDVDFYGLDEKRVDEIAGELQGELDARVG